jgi:DNA-binding IclR family transcriptional regulator
LLETLAKSIRVINFVAEQEAPVGVREIAKAVGINSSTTSRILKTFKKAGFVDQDPINSKYKLGMRVFELGIKWQKSYELRDLMRPTLESMVRITKETAALSILDNGERVCIERVETPHSIRTSLYIGKREPIHISASGKAMMAYIPEDELEWIIAEKGLPRFTAKTITDPKVLKKELHKIRNRGYAIDSGESEIDVRCVAAALIRKPDTVVGSISICTPEYRVNSSRIKKWGKLIKDTCESASNLI